MNEAHKNYIVLTCFVILALGCKPGEDDRSTGAAGTSRRDIVNLYPPLIHERGLDSLYDQSKWHVYSYFAHKKLQFFEFTGIKDTVTYGELPLKFDHVEVRDDTIEIDHLFYYGDVNVSGVLVENDPAWGCVFAGPKHELVLVSGRNEMRYTGASPHEPLEAEFIDYVRKNKAILDPWLYREAIKRGVINE